MIFDKNYDKALWLLVASNKDDSERICKLINSIPKDIYLNIQNAIYNYYNGNYYDKKTNNVREKIIYSSTLIDNDGFESAITVKIVLGRLCFNIYRWKEDIERVEEEYELLLKDFENQDLSEMYYFDKNFIGRYSSEINNIKFVGYLTDVNTINIDRKYYLKRIPFCFIVSSFIGKKRIGMKIINVNKNMPEEIYFDDFSSKDKIDGLVKKKVRNKNK